MIEKKVSFLKISCQNAALAWMMPFHVGIMDFQYILRAWNIKCILQRESGPQCDFSDF